MNFLRKTREWSGNRVREVFYLGNLEILKVEKSGLRKRWYFFNYKILSYRSNPVNGSDVKKIISTVNKSCNNLNIWIDHNFGGGTEVYTCRRFEKLLLNSNEILRIQYLNSDDAYKITLFTKRVCDQYIVNNISSLYNILLECEYRALTVNSLVGYKNSLDIIGLIAKIRTKKNIEVRFNVHDYQCICPSFNLINGSGRFCELNFAKCRTCYGTLRLSDNIHDEIILRSGARDLDSWRAVWRNFLVNTCDVLETFSRSSADILAKAYPDVIDKIKVTPHEIPCLRKVKIKKHSGINIGFLGQLSLPQKGANIVRAMGDYLSGSNTNIKLFVIGELKNAPECVAVTGRYALVDLADIVEELQIDCVIIPSICPETFSYTTSEAIQLGLPVFSFRYGAQAEKVQAYPKGTILKSELPEDIINTVEKVLTHS